MIVLKATNLTKVYGGQGGIVPVRALDSFNLTVHDGEFVGIMGPSGSGKTTLLHLLGTIDRPTSGEVEVRGQRLSTLDGRGLAAFRRKHLGFIFQDYNLLDSLTIRENIVLPLVLEKYPLPEIDRRVSDLCHRMGLSNILSHYPYAVSGGQKQRAAAARALIHSPALVLADEPTGNLDSKSAQTLMDSLEALNQGTSGQPATILMVTHDPVSASYCRRILFIRDGQFFTEVRRGADRQQFFQQILDVLSAMGGDGHDVVYARR